MKQDPPAVHNIIDSTVDNTVYDVNIQTESGYNITRVVYEGSHGDTAFIRFTDHKGTEHRTSVDCEYDSVGFGDESELVHTPRIIPRSYSGTDMHKEVLDAVVDRKLRPSEEETIASSMILKI